MRAQNPLSDRRRFYLETIYTPQFQLDEESIKDIPEEELKARRSKLKQLLDWIDAADPSQSGKYAIWIAKLYKRELIRFPEDIEKINSRLQEFERVKHTLPVHLRDINQFPNYGNLARTLDEHSGIGVREAERLAIIAGQEVIYEVPPFRVIKVTTQEAATKLARHTEWCVKDPEWGASYLEWGPLYFIDRSRSKVAHQESQPVYERYALAWRGSCEHRKEQFEKFLAFAEKCDSEGVCYFCLKPIRFCKPDVAPAESQQSKRRRVRRRHLTDARRNHSISEDDVSYVVRLKSFDSFNETLISEKGEVYPEHLKPFLSETMCHESYSVLDVYDSPFTKAAMQRLRPILFLIFKPSAKSSRKNLNAFYYSILQGTENAEWEDILLNEGDADKIVDYLESLNSPMRGRWLAAESIIFTKYRAAARYYQWLKTKTHELPPGSEPVLTSKDEAELKELSKNIKASKPDPKEITCPKFPKTSRLREVLFQDAALEDRIQRLTSRVRQQQEQLKTKIATDEKKFYQSEERFRNLLRDALDKADRGVPVEKLLPSLIEQGRNFYSKTGDYYDSEDLEHPFTKFLIDLIDYYNKGFIIGKQRQRLSKKRFTQVPYLYDAEYYVTHPWETLSRRERYVPFTTKARKAREALVNFADSKIRYNPLPYHRRLPGVRKISSTAFGLEQAKDQYRFTSLAAARSVQRIIWVWMRKYGLSWTRGHTFMEQRRYAKEILSASAGKRVKDLIDSQITAPGIVLCRGNYNDDLFAVLMQRTDSIFFQKLKAKYFADDPKSKAKLQLIVGKLHRELTTLLKRNGWKVIPTGKVIHVRGSGYGGRRGKLYHVFAIQPAAQGRSDRLRGLVPFYR